MFRYRSPIRAASVLAMSLALVAAMAPQAFAANVNFIGGADGNPGDWADPSNWTSGVPTDIDDVIVNYSLDGAVILDTEQEEINSLRLDGGLNVNRGGQLTVTGNVVNNGVNSSYFINDGTVIVDGIIENTCTNCSDNDPDNDQSGYIGNTFAMTGNLDNAGAAINDGTGGGATWVGDVLHNTDFIDNGGGIWTGKIFDNTGGIFNQQHGTWLGGDVLSNSGTIENNGGSSWTGDVVANGGAGQINNLEGASWTGDVQTNDGSVNNDGSTWTGDVLSNDGGIINTANSVWNGNMTNNADGSLDLSGVVNGFIDNSGTLYSHGVLSGVHDLTNTGSIVMQNGVAGDSISAQNWSGAGSATFEFSPSEGRADHVVLSGSYDAATDLDIEWIGSDRGRAYGDMPIITAAGVTGTVTLTSGLPDDGVISYQLVQSEHGWTITTTLSKAPEHVASALDLMGDTVASATQIPADRSDACGQDGGWARSLGGAQSGRLGDTPSGAGLGGLQVGYDLTCVALPGARLGIGMTAGTSGGRVVQDFGGGDRVDGMFEQSFAGVYGKLVAGSLHAVLQGQLGFGGLTVSDPHANLNAATLSTLRLDVSGNASYALALGDVSLAPELGFAGSVAEAHSSDFADVGAMQLDSAPTLDAYVGATLSGDIVLPDGATTLSPFASLALHGELLSQRTALFTDDAGGRATVPVETAGSYVALSLGANALHTLTDSGRSLDAGLKADFRLGPQVADSSFSGYAQVKF